MRHFAISIVLLTCAGSLLNPLAAQTSAPKPMELGGVSVTGSLQTRVESWDWFSANADGDYTYPASILRLSLS